MQRNDAARIPPIAAAKRPDLLGMLFLPVLRRFARTQTVRVLSAGAIVYDECHSIFNVVEERGLRAELASHIPSCRKSHRLPHRRDAAGFSCLERGWLKGRVGAPLHLRLAGASARNKVGNSNGCLACLIRCGRSLICYRARSRGQLPNLQGRGTKDRPLDHLSSHTRGGELMSTSQRQPRFPLHRRDVLKGGASLAAAAGLPGGLIGTAAARHKHARDRRAGDAAEPGLQLRRQPRHVRVDRRALRRPARLQKNPRPESAWRLPRGHRCSSGQAGRRRHAGQAGRSLELDPGGKFIRFQLRQGVKSNWGNELTAEDVKWTWDRKFALGALGAFFLLDVSAWKTPDDVKVEGKYTVSFNLDNPNPLLLKIQPNLYNPIYDARSARQGAAADDPWARKFLENNSAGFGPYRLQQLVARAAGGVQGEGRLLRRQAGDRHGDLPRGADLGDPRLAAAGRGGRHRPVPAAAGDHQTAAARPRAWRSTASTPRS